MENQKINQIHHSNNLITHNIVYMNLRKNGYTRFLRRNLK